MTAGEKATRTVVALIIEQLAIEYKLNTISKSARDFYLEEDRKCPRFLGKRAAVSNNRVIEKILEEIKKTI
jgi:hypothetical protein